MPPVNDSPRPRGAALASVACQRLPHGLAIRRGGGTEKGLAMKTILNHKDFVSEVHHAEVRVREAVKAYRAAEKVFLASAKRPADARLFWEARQGVLLQQQAQRAVDRATV